MAFNFKNSDEFSYKSPQEMYQDNKSKKIMGLLDYQTAMLIKYMDSYLRRNVALELQTGK